MIKFNYLIKYIKSLQQKKLCKNEKDIYEIKENLYDKLKNIHSKTEED